MSDPFTSNSGGKSINPRVQFWQKELENAQKREKIFRKEADRVVKIYEGDKRAENSFNVLFSNTETLLPACYNQLPRPFVDRRFKDSDPLGKLAAQALERTLAVLEDSGNAEYEPFTKLMEQAVLGGLVPGRGVTWFKYDADFEKSDGAEDSLPSDADETQKQAEGEVEGEDILQRPSEKVKYETVCGEDVDYDEFLHGPGRQWVKVPWVARYHMMTEADAVASFGKAIAGKMKYASETKMGADGWKSKSGDDNYPLGSQNVAPVWEIWNREKKEVIFYSPTYTQDLLKTEDDPLGLSGFFPCPEPLRFMLKRSKLTPTPLYTLYEEQAKELNRITTRINKILGALKVRGFYDGSLEGLKTLLDSDDNTLLPALNVAAMKDGSNLQNSIWFMPFDMLVAALQALWQGREEIKDTIYEITGMADIMRGEGAASAPATTQNIKNQWGTLRLKRWQRYVQEYVRGCLRIMAELAGKHFSLETFAQLTDLPFALPADIAKAQKTMAALNKQMQMMQQQAMMQQQSMASPLGAPGPQQGTGPVQSAPPGPPAGGPPPGQAAAPAGPQAGPQPVQPTPQMVQAMQASQAVLAKPKWEDVVGLLREDMERYYRIDIETNSTIAADSQEDKENMSEAMQALSQMFSSWIPMVEQGAMTMPAVKAIILSAMRKFDFGREVEDAISQMPDQLPPPPPPPGQPTPAELQAKQQQAQVDIQLAQLKLQGSQQQSQMDQQTAQIKMAQMQRQEQLDQQEHQFKLAEMQMKMQQLQMQGQVDQADARADMMSSQADMESAHRKGIVDSITADADMQKAKLSVETAKAQAKAAKQRPKPAGRAN